MPLFNFQDKFIIVPKNNDITTKTSSPPPVDGRNGKLFYLSIIAPLLYHKVLFCYSFIDYFLFILFIFIIYDSSR